MQTFIIPSNLQGAFSANKCFIRGLTIKFPEWTRKNFIYIQGGSKKTFICSLKYRLWEIIIIS